MASLTLHRVVAAVAMAVACIVGSPMAQAADAINVAADPVLEARMVRITTELRCLVCQNQTVADSQAGLANDLREQVRAMLQKGSSDDEIIAFMIARYGDFVLYRPPMKSTTVLLWAGPAVLLLGGLTLLVVVLRRRQRLPDEAFEPDGDELDATTDPTRAVITASTQPSSIQTTQP